MNSQRERILLISVVALVGFFALRAMMTNLFLEPLDRQRVEVQNLEQELGSKQLQLESVFTANAKVADWEKISLPSDEWLAESLYLEFLEGLAKECGFRERDVSLNRTLPGEHFTRVRPTIEGRVSLKNLTEFLYRFHQPKLLHQVRSLSVQRLDKTDRQLNVKIQVEALTLSTSPARRDRLLDEDQETGGPLLAGYDRDDFILISKTNILAPYRDDPPPQREPPPKPSVDEARHIQFTGSTLDGTSMYQAWLYDRLTNTCLYLQPGDEFEVAGVKGKMTEVTQSVMTFELEGKNWTLNLGSFLNDKRAISLGESSNLETEEQEPSSESETNPNIVSENSAEKDKESDAVPVKPVESGQTIEDNTTGA